MNEIELKQTQTQSKNHPKTQRSRVNKDTVDIRWCKMQVQDMINPHSYTVNVCHQFLQYFILYQL